jgi:predicted lipid-binding transport protein (Tim44 family)
MRKRDTKNMTANMVRLALATGLAAFMLVATPVHHKQVEAGILGGALGGALFGGLIGGRGGMVGGAIMGGVIGGVSKAAKRNRRRYYRQGMNRRYRGYRRRGY